MSEPDEKIRLLPVHVANQIAAGEVVERPASVVKELVENALDAGANAIDVAVTQGGRTLIRVADDGIGMDRDDALMSIERQATSKIRDAADIQRIATLGFRGEALASIASVSRFCLCTCRRGQDAGTQISIAGGRGLEVREAGRAAGTTVDVRDLFYNVPARRKFLRARQTELAHIRTVFIRQALSHPQCALTLRVDGRELYRLPGGATLEDRIRDLFGAEYLAALRPLRQARGDLSVTGLIALPGWTRADTAEQFIFVNRRPASAAVIAVALRDAYPPLEGNRRPVTFLFVELPPDQVDVNVHPTKQEVRFRQPGAVRDAIAGAVRGVFDGSAGAPPRTGPAGPSNPPPGAQPARLPPPAPPPDPAVTLRFSTPLFRHTPSAAAGAAPAPAADPTPPPAAADGLEPADGSDASSRPGPWTWCRILGQVGGRYVLIETDGGYAVLDPRAAHERVLYERLAGALRKGRPHAQPLLIPEAVPLPPEDADRLRRHLDRLESLGFGIREFGDGHFLVESLPEGFGDVPCRPLLIELAQGLDRGGARAQPPETRNESLLCIAIRNAVQARRALNDREVESLVRDLAACRMPYTCPRGRPTMLFTSLRELARKFGHDR